MKQTDWRLSVKSIKREQKLVLAQNFHHLKFHLNRFDASVCILL